MKAIILAAGRGSRLRPFTDTSPKCLTELGGMTLLDRQLATLRAGGIDDIVIATGYCADQLERPGVQSVHNSRWAETNMVETLFEAERDFGDDLIVCYADIAYRPEVLEALLAVEREIVVTVDRAWRDYWAQRFDDPLDDAETLQFGNDGRIVEIGSTATDYDSIEAQYIGLMRFRGRGLDALRRAHAGMANSNLPWRRARSPEKAYMTDLLMEMISAGECLWPAFIEGAWLEIDTVRDLEVAENYRSDVFV